MLLLRSIAVLLCLTAACSAQYTFAWNTSSEDTTDLACGDFDGDGVVDCFQAVFNQSNRVLFRSSAAQLSFNAPISVGTPTFTNGLFSFDLEGNGRDSVIACNAVGQNTEVLYWDSGRALTTVLISDLAVETIDAAVGDVDFDGIEDVVLISYRAAHNVYRNLRSQNLVSFGTAGADAVTNTSRALGGELADFNGDNYADLVVAMDGSRNQVYFNDGAGGFPSVPDLYLGEEFQVTLDVVVADFNSDGFIDIAFANSGTPNEVYTNDGSGGFTRTSQFGEDGESQRLDAMDCTGDGYIDIAVANWDRPSEVFYNSDGLFGPFYDSSLGLLESVAIVFADLTASAAPEVVLGNANYEDAVYVGEFISATVSSTEPSRTATNPIPFTVTFSQPVDGFDLSTGIKVKGGNSSNLVGGDGSSVFTLDVVPSGDGPVAVKVLPNVCTDTATGLLSNTGSWSATVYYDTLPPQPVIFSPGANFYEGRPYTKESPFQLAVEFGEPVVGFTVSDLTVSGASVENFTVVEGSENSEWTFDVVPAADGTNVTVSMAAAAVVDELARPSLAASFWVQYDITPPTVLFTPTDGVYTTKPIPISFAMSEETRTFGEAALLITGGTVSNFDYDAKTFDIVPTINGTIYMGVKNNSVFDLAGNGAVQTGAQPFNTYDIERPTATISTGGRSSNANPIPVTITFREPVSGFTLGDVSVSNCGGCSTQSFVGSDGSSVYTLEIVPDTETDYLIEVAGGVAFDIASNPNKPFSHRVRYDLTPPACNITAAAAYAVNPFEVVLTFDEEVITPLSTAFDVVGPASVTDVTRVSGNRYLVELTATTEGTISINMQAGGTTDYVGYPTAASPVAVTKYDTTPITATFYMGSDPSDFQPGATNDPSQMVFIRVDDYPNDINNTDLVCVNCICGPLSLEEGGDYSFVVSPTAGDAQMDISLPAGRVFDAAGNPNLASTYSLRYDTVPPTVVISSVESPGTARLPIPVVAQWSEDVMGFTGAGVFTSAGAVSDFVQESRSRYTFNVNPLKDSTVQVIIGPGAATDMGGNDLAGNTIWSINYESTEPVTSITSPEGEYSTSLPFPVVITFSKPVIDFFASDIIVDGDGAALTNFVRVNGNEHTFDVTMPAEGSFTVTVDRAVTRDASGIPNTAATFTGTYDITPPTGVLAANTPVASSRNPIPITFTTSEPVTGFLMNKVSVTGGTKSPTFSRNPDFTRFSFTVTPDAEGPPIDIVVPSNAVMDYAGFELTADVSMTIRYDVTAPTVVLTSPTHGTLTNEDPIIFTATFSEDVPLPSASHFVSTGAVVTSVDGSGSVFNVTMEPSRDGIVEVAGKQFGLRDYAGNVVPSTNVLSWTSDTTKPTVTIVSLTPQRTNERPMIIRMTFSEVVSGFTAAGVWLDGTATLDNFSQETPTVYTFNLNPPADGTTLVSLTPTAAYDAAGNAAIVPAAFPAIYDTTGPVLTMSTNSSSPTADDPVIITAKFDEPVIVLRLSDIKSTNAVPSSLVRMASDEYRFNLATIDDGPVVVWVEAGSVSDTLGYTMPAESRFEYEADVTPPRVLLAAPSLTGAPTDDSTIAFTASMSEVTMGFTIGDIEVENGNVTDFVETAPGTEYSFNIIPDSRGTVKVTVPAGALTDAVGLPNPAAVYTFVYGTPAPASIEENGPSLLQKYGYTAGAIFAIFLLVFGIVASCVIGFAIYVDNEKKKRKKALAEEKLRSGRALTIQEGNEIYADDHDDEDDIYGVSLADVDVRRESVVSDVEDKKIFGITRSSTVTKNLKRQKKELEHRRASGNDPRRASGGSLMESSDVGSAPPPPRAPHLEAVQEDRRDSFVSLDMDRATGTAAARK